jgi:hypothetical protein
MPSPVSALTKIKSMFSPLERTIAAHKMEAMPSAQWAAYIKANAPKSAKKEALSVKLNELLERQPKVSKQDIIKHIQENSPKIKTKVIGAKAYTDEDVLAGKLPFYVERKFLGENKWGDPEYQYLDENNEVAYRSSNPNAVLQYASDAEPNQLKYADYTLPGGQNYKEMLLSLPRNELSTTPRMQKVYEITDANGQLLSSGQLPMSPRMLEKINNNPDWQVREFEQANPNDVRRDTANFQSSHYEEPNILAHLRMNERPTAEGGRALFLEELQSDWAQQGRKQGFKPNTAEEYYNQKAIPLGATPWEKLDDDMRAQLSKIYETEKGIPRGPYVEDTGDWTALGLKKAIERAVDEGQSHLAWTTGAQQADRYNLAKQIDELMVTKNPDNTVSMRATLPGGGEQRIGDNIPIGSVSDYIGSDLAKQIEAQGVGGEVYNADALRIGGEGMKTYYDQIVPSTANDILKSMGVTERVKPIGVQLGDNVSEQMGFEITPEIRDYVMNQGLPAFAGGGAVKVAAKNLRELADHYLTPKATPAVNRIDMNYKDVTKRVPELTRAANMLETGEISASEYDKLVNSLKPVTPYSFVPAPATYEDAMRALTKNKQPMFGRASEIPAGEQTDLRLDIPAYKDHGVWVNSIHRKDAPTVYDSVSSVKNATMIGAPEKALKVAKGGPKAPFAVIRGEWNPISQEDAVKKAQENIASGEWVQVGYDPERHGYFYDRKTMEPIAGAEEILQIGPLVIAKNPAYAAKAEQKFAGGGKVSSDPFADLSVLDKAELLAKAAKYRIKYNKQAVDHGKYPDALSSELKKKYLDLVGNSRVNRSPLDAALNYGGGYDFGVRQDVPADVARDMGKAYQYTDYFFSPFTGPKSDAVGDYYENMAGVEAGIKERGRRATEAEIQRRSAEYGRRSSKMLPQYEEENFARGGAVESDEVDYDQMYEFKDYGNRETGEAKDTGALGEIRMPNGRDVMTEYSINVDGREMPSIIEGMHPADLNYIRETGTVPEDAVATAVRSANKREARGKSSFWNKKDVPAFAQGGAVDYDAMYEFR